MYKNIAKYTTRDVIDCKECKGTNNWQWRGAKCQNRRNTSTSQKRPINIQDNDWGIAYKGIE